MRNPLTAAMEELEATRAKIKHLRRDSPEKWKSDFGRLRPVLDQKREAVAREGDTWLRVHGAAGQREELARLVAAATKSTQHHQACWPLLVIKSDDPEYLASVKTIDADYANLVQFVNRLR